MSFCKFGREQREGSGIYYMCSQTNGACMFSRWCNLENKFKPSANYQSCTLKDKQEGFVITRGAKARSSKKQK